MSEGSYLHNLLLTHRVFNFHSHTFRRGLLYSFLIGALFDDDDDDEYYVGFFVAFG